MKLLLLSDIHGNYTALESVLNTRPDFDLIFCLGDYLWTSLGNHRVIQWVEKMRSEGNVLLKGNSDAMNYYSTFGGLSAEDPKPWYEALQGLPTSSEMDLDGFKVFATHGYPKSKEFSQVFRDRGDPLPWMKPAYIREALNLEDVEIVLFGDIHLPFVEAGGDLLAVNPGGVGFNFDGDPRASAMILEMGRKRVVVEHLRVEYDIDKAVGDVEEAFTDRDMGRERGESFRALISGGRDGPFEWRTEWMRTVWQVQGDRCWEMIA